MKHIFILCICSIVSLCWADNATPDHQKTSAPLDARYEFVQSQISVRGTYKLDKYSGAVYQIVTTKDGDIGWQEIYKKNHPLDKRTDGMVNYQIFTSGISFRFTFLINVNTGATWQLLETSQKELVWLPIL